MQVGWSSAAPLLLQLLLLLLLLLLLGLDVGGHKLWGFGVQRGGTELREHCR